MKKLLLPIILLLLGLGGGVGAGILLMPTAEAPDAPEDGAAPADEDASDETADAESPEGEGEDAAAKDDSTATEDEDDAMGAVEFLNMSNQFIIPLVDDGLVNGIVVVSISLEVVEGTIAEVHTLEPKVRDRFLQVLFNHANNGGFSGNFTDFRYIKSLKDELLRNAQVVAGKNVTDVLILDLVRQDP